MFQLRHAHIFPRDGNRWYFNRQAVFYFKIGGRKNIICISSIKILHRKKDVNNVQKAVIRIFN